MCSIAANVSDCQSEEWGSIPPHTAIKKINMKLDKRLKKKIDKYFDKISSEDLYKKLSKHKKS